MIEFTVNSRQKQEPIDLTARIQSEIERTGVTSGLCYVFCPHTTAGLTINEAEDPAVMEDMFGFLARAVPEAGPWTHSEGNSPAHVKTSLLGSSLIVGIEEGRLSLGTWQGVFLCEFDGPRSRRVNLRILA